MKCTHFNNNTLISSATFLISDEVRELSEQKHREMIIGGPDNELRAKTRSFF